MNITVLSGNTSLTVSGLELNLTAGEASDTNLQYEINNSGPIGESADYINVTQVAGDTVQGDADNSGDLNTDGSGSDDLTASSLAIGATQTSQVQLQNTTSGSNGANYDSNQPLGGKELTLSADAPDGASASLNTTSLTTDTNGLAEFNVTLGDTTGTYNVTVASADNSDVNVTLQYEASSGPVNQFNVTGDENALIDTSGLDSGPSEVETAAYRVQIEDANGNLNNSASTSVDFEVSASGDAEVRSVAYGLDSDGTASTDASTATLDSTLSGDTYTYNYGDDGDTTAEGQSGVFYVFVSNPTAGETDVTVSQSGTSDTGTATFFDTVDTVDVSLNQTTVAAGDSVTADVVTQTSDGTTIEVPRLSAAVTSNNSSVVTVDSSPVLTAANGTATATLTAQGNGTTFVNATVSGVTGSTELTVGGQADTGSPLGGTAGEYDADGDGEITISELANAGSAYTDGELTISELAEVGAAYTSSN